VAVPPDPSFEKTLAARGVSSGVAIALDATVTPEALGLRAAAGPDAIGAKGLPAISLSFPDETPHAVPPEDRELEVLSLLGEGGMGAVYLARERVLGREVAIKTTRSVASVDAISALCTEAVVTGHLEHPGIVPVHQLARANDGRPVLVMKRIEGTTWRQLLHDPAHPAWQRLPAGDSAIERRAFHLEILRRVSEAIAFAHRRGIVHRDIKADNVMVGEFGEVYVVDWGLAVRIGQQRPDEPLIGTPIYLAPEMVHGGPVDARTDVYLLGGALHEILTGAPPHPGATIAEVLLHASESPPPTYGPDVPADLAALATRALARDPADRPRDGGEMRDALAAHARHRASIELSRRAEERLADLASRLAATIREEDLPTLYQLLAECRFGFMEAQREWPENPRTAQGLERCHEAATQIEISRRDPRAARAALAALASPRPALVLAVEALEREASAERAERERTRRLAEIADAGAEPRARLLAGAIGGAGALGLSGYAMWLDAHGGTGAIELVWFVAAATVLAAVVVATLGRALLAHAFNRRLVAWMFANLAGIFANRVVGLLAGVAAPAVLAGDLGVMATCFALGALWLFPQLGIGAAVLLSGALVAATMPSLALAAFTASTGLALVIALLAARRAQRLAVAPAAAAPREPMRLSMTP
jgi:hypothetical protein